MSHGGNVPTADRLNKSLIHQLTDFGLHLARRRPAVDHHRGELLTRDAATCVDLRHSQVCDCFGRWRVDTTRALKG